MGAGWLGLFGSAISSGGRNRETKSEVTRLGEGKSIL